MEKEKDTNKIVEEMMKHRKELFLTKELALKNDEIVENQYMKKIPINFLMLNIRTRHLMKTFKTLLLLHINKRT
jgi:hypothetical protein